MRWLAVALAVCVATGPAVLGLYRTEDHACTQLWAEPLGQATRIHAITDSYDYLVASHCEAVRHGGAPPIERTVINWTGTIGSGFFLVGVFFGSAGILGLIDRRRAGLVTGACVLICFGAVVAFFA